ncbi:hypothetical protein ACFPER_12895 [Agromyces aurantiacus]|uniref:Multidrug transporter n=1 Tax=Agromyces aurantiacus TaxID=165814 RepID=A0ABV9R6C6_9MICO|nr:hypothetical protein [Agromyces aurantiacus]MBM7504380.1 hypothetical protein [Agromyces aurantiacus]
MDESTGVGGEIADDHEFQVAQDGEPPAAAPAADDDARPVGDEPDDEVTGIDAERRVPLPEERGRAEED